MKDRVLISFSGGETSGYMLYYLTNLWEGRHECEFLVVFANTGEENEETLEFVKKCGEAFNVDIVWVEALVTMEMGVGTKHKIVDFDTASRNGEPFEAIIKKYGIPNQAFPHCNREMKLNPIHSYVKSIGWDKGYKTAIGIRYDEIDRIVSDRKKYNVIYPLIEYKKMTKPKINFWWSQQEFRLNLKSYQGNCKTCWKKSIRNLSKIAQDNPEHFDFFKKMEKKYGMLVPDGREPILDEEGNQIPAKFFRGARSVQDIFNGLDYFNGIVRDASDNTNYQLDIFDEEESCDIFSMCGQQD